MSYSIEVSKKAERQLKKLTDEVKIKFKEAIENLDNEPFPPGVEKLEGMKDTYRIRRGNHRFVYKVDKKEKEILILSIGDRKDIYK